VSAAASALHGADAIANRQANAAIDPRAPRALGSLDSPSKKRRAGSARGRGGMGNVSISRDPAGVSWRKIQRAIVVTIRSKKQAITDGLKADLMPISTRGSSICVLGRAGLRTRVASCRHMRWQEAQAAIGWCADFRTFESSYSVIKAPARRGDSYQARNHRPVRSIRLGLSCEGPAYPEAAPSGEGLSRLFG